jgi:hypothetical protein
MQDHLTDEKLRLDSQMQEKMNRILKSVEDKYEKEIEKVENEVRDIKKRNKLELKIIITKIKEKER